MSLKIQINEGIRKIVHYVNILKDCVDKEMLKCVRVSITT